MIVVEVVMAHDTFFLLCTYIKIMVSMYMHREKGGNGYVLINMGRK